MDRGVPSLPKKEKSSRGRLREFLRVEEIGSHVNRVKGTLDNIVFRGMEESEQEIRRKRIYFSFFALILLVSLGVTLSRRAQSEVAIFNPSSCLGGWTNVANATGKQETGAGTPFSNLNSAILPADTIADLFCGDFKGEIPENKDPQVLVLRIEWSTEGTTTVPESIISTDFASSTNQILDSPASDNENFMLIESTSSASSSPTENVPAENPAPQETPASTTPEEPASSSPQSSAVYRVFASAIEAAFARAYAQEQTSSAVSSDTPPSVLSSPIDTPPLPASTAEASPNASSVLDSPLNDAPSPQIDSSMNDASSSQTETATSANQEEVPSILSSPIDTPAETAPVNEQSSSSDVLTSPLDDNPLLASSTDAVATDTEATSTNEATTTPDDTGPLFEIEYSFDGVTWTNLGGVTLESIRATQFEIPVPSDLSWAKLSTLQIHIKRNPSIDVAPAIYLDSITLEVQMVNALHEPTMHPDFERDAILQDKSSGNIRVVNIINSETRNRELWYTTVNDQGSFGVASGTWAQVVPNQSSSTYRLIDVDNGNVFFIEDESRMLWVTNLERFTSDGISLLSKGTTSANFIKPDGEEWVFEYNAATKATMMHAKDE